ncbi:MAG: ATP-binding protein [Faecousia sp.]
MKHPKKTSHFGFLLLFSMVVFLSVVLNAGIAAVVIYLLIQSNLIRVVGTTAAGAARIIGFFAVFSIPIGVIVALVAGKIPLKPVRNLIDSMDRLASGDFGTRVNVGIVMRRYPPFVDVAMSFNKMAEQLENTEMLRGDFINNFSHEFKTPIVSIAGFAKLLRRGGLSPEQQQEYLAIIEEESLRLSYMATNVLNLTKIENQTILSDVSRFNLSEQIRSCILLLENKWEKKNLDFSLGLQEHFIRANEELLKQVWINLLDNAVKFSPEGELIEVAILETEQNYCVTVRNCGATIPPEQQEKIFNKFYQCDESHAAEGNGVGLAIVKRVVELHRGTVKVSSRNNVTIFTVELPKGL